MKKLAGRFISGMVWGTAAALILSVVRPAHGSPKQIARGFVKGLLSLADVTAEARETIGDLYAEVRMEQEAETV